MRTPSEQQLAWLRISLEPGLQSAAARELLARAGSAAGVYALPEEKLAAWVGVTLASQMLAPPGAALTRAMDAAQAWAAHEGHSLVTLGDEIYPAALREIHDPPPVLYVAGLVQCLKRPSMAIVGARHATPGGLELAREFAQALAARGWCVVSGLALGIDAAAHEGALLAGASGGGTLAVLGTGADVLYPRRNRGLAGRLVEQGAIISELPLGTPPSRFQFPRRNRLVAGLVQGVLVVEAATRSGSLITARLASEMGREVFAIPGSIHSPLSRGCHALIRQGAKLTEEVDDILVELAPLAGEGVRFGPIGRESVTPSAVEAPIPAHVDERRILDALGYDPLSVDELAQRTRLGSDVLLGVLLLLELNGRIARLDGGRFQRLRGGNVGGGRRE